MFPSDDTQVIVTGPEEVPSEARLSVMYVLTCVTCLHEVAACCFFSLVLVSSDFFFSVTC